MSGRVIGERRSIRSVIISVFDWYREFSDEPVCRFEPSSFPSSGSWQADSTAKSYPLEERKLLRKLDLCILIFGSISCESPARLMSRNMRDVQPHPVPFSVVLTAPVFCRFLGQQNITNAFVSEMREDLGAWGNELNYYKMACTFGVSSPKGRQSSARKRS